MTSERVKHLRVLKTRKRVVHARPTSQERTLPSDHSLSYFIQAEYLADWPTQSRVALNRPTAAGSILPQFLKPMICTPRVALPRDFPCTVILRRTMHRTQSTCQSMELSWTNQQDQRSNACHERLNKSYTISERLSANFARLPFPGVTLGPSEWSGERRGTGSLARAWHSNPRTG